MTIQGMLPHETCCSKLQSFAFDPGSPHFAKVPFIVQLVALIYSGQIVPVLFPSLTAG